MTFNKKEWSLILFSTFLVSFNFSKNIQRDISSQENFSKQDYESYNKNWGLNKEGVNAYSAWSKGRSSHKVLVAVVDTGVNINHPDLKENMWKNPGETGTYRGYTGYSISLTPTIKDKVGKWVDKKTGKETTKENLNAQKVYQGEMTIFTTPTSEDMIGKVYDKSTDGIDNDLNGYVDDVRGWDFYEEEDISYDFHGHGTHISGIVAGKIDLKKGVGGVAPEASFSSYRYYVDGKQYFNKVNKLYDKECINKEDDEFKFISFFGEKVSCSFLFSKKEMGKIFKENGCTIDPNQIGCRSMETRLGLADLNIKLTVQSLDLAAKHGAKIINYSAGGGSSTDEEFKILKLLEEKNILVVVAAGNEKSNSDLRGNYYYPCAYNLKNMICVGSVDKNSKKNDHSNWGTKLVHISAPGKDIYSTSSEYEGSYDRLSGTSQATAFVSGIAAILIDKYPQFSMIEIKDIILKSARKDPGLKDFNQVSGVADAEKALILAENILKFKEMKDLKQREIAREKNKK